MVGTSWLIAGFGIGLILGAPVMLVLKRLTVGRKPEYKSPVAWNDANQGIPVFDHEYSRGEVKLLGSEHESIGVLNVAGSGQYQVAGH